MSIFSKFFGNSKQRQIKKLQTETEKKIEKEYGPIGKVGMAIIQASTNCRDAVKELIEAPNENERIQQEVYIFYEFIYFFIHMAMRQAQSQLSEQQMEKVQEYLGPILSGVAIDSYFAHWPQELKDKLVSEFYDRLNGSELEYTECTNKYPTGDMQAKLRGLFMQLGSNVSSLARHGETDIAIVFPVSKIAIEEWTKMNLDKLVKDIKIAN